jgi:hypothetical protein
MSKIQTGLRQPHFNKMYFMSMAVGVTQIIRFVATSVTSVEASIDPTQAFGFFDVQVAAMLYVWHTISQLRILLFTFWGDPKVNLESANAADGSSAAGAAASSAAGASHAGSSSAAGASHAGSDDWVVNALISKSEGKKPLSCLWGRVRR